MPKSMALEKTIMMISQKDKMVLPYDPTIMFLGINTMSLKCMFPQKS